MFDLKIKSNIKEFTKNLNKIQRKQIPFATARALTWTAQEMQKAEQAAIPKRFHVTKKWWLKQQPTGIKVEPAKKDRLTARVYTRAHFANLQEDGGVKTPYRHKGLLIPSDNVPKYGRKAGGANRVLSGKKILRRGGKPNGSFIIKMPSGKLGVWRRKGKKRGDIQLLYTYVPSALVQARFRFRETAASVGALAFREQFERSLKSALKSAR